MYPVNVLSLKRTAKSDSAQGNFLIRLFGNFMHELLEAMFDFEVLKIL